MDQYTVRFNDDQDLVRVFASGELSRSQGEEIITEARTLAAQHGCNTLYDVRKSSPGFSIVDLYFVPRELEALKDPRMRKSKAAILTSPSGGVEEYKFYENVATNLGLSVKVFFDEDDAIDWLARTQA